MKIQRVPTEYKKFIKGYVKDKHRDFINPHFGIDNDGDPLIWEGNGTILLAAFDLKYDNLFHTKDLIELVQNAVGFKYNWIFKSNIEFMIDNEIFESDLFQAIYGNID